MKDAEIEERLRQYRPVGPPAQLRDSILATDQVQRIWPWAAAAAVLLVSVMTLRAATRHETASADVSAGTAAADRAADDLTRRLGGDAVARRLAEFIVFEEPDPDEAKEGEPQP